jgi:hypothetical protein
MNIYLLHFEGEIDDVPGAEDRLETHTSFKDAQRAFKEAQEEYCGNNTGKFCTHSVSLVKATLKKLSPKRMICLALEAPKSRALFNTWEQIAEHDSTATCGRCEYCDENHEEPYLY